MGLIPPGSLGRHIIVRKIFRLASTETAVVQLLEDFTLTIPKRKSSD